MQFQQQPKANKGVWILLAAGVVATALIIMSALGVFSGGNRKMTYSKLRCISTQDVTPFGNKILYYDGTTLFCTKANGDELWNYTLGSGAGFSAGEENLVAWVGNQLFIFDEDGHSTYNDHLTGEVQFARCGSRYVAAVVGSSISPTLIIKDMDGIDVDTESTAYEDMIILDCGFFSGGEYLWSTALDVYGTVPNTTMYTIRVGQMNTGEVSLGEPLVYEVIYAGNELNVITTRQLTQYDYRGTQDANGTKLVYGWQLIDHDVSGNNAQLLFATSLQAADMTGSGISTLRFIQGAADIQYTLPSACSGAAIYKGKIYAFASDSIYRADFSDRRFAALSLPMDAEVSQFLGMLDNGVALLACGSDVYAVQMN